MFATSNGTETVENELFLLPSNNSRHYLREETENIQPATTRYMNLH